MNKEINPIKLFKEECITEVSQQGNDLELVETSKKWLGQSAKHKYSYHFTWLGRPIIQLPQDILALQEIIWETKPDIIIETGIAHGGSLCFSASMLALLDMADLQHQTKKRDSSTIERKVIGIDIDIRNHNRRAIQCHPMAHKITMIEGSSIEQSIFERVEKLVPKGSKVLVMLDSNHTEAHVLKELKLYTNLVTKNSYCIVFDTIVAQMPNEFNKDRPWDKNNNPKSAMDKFLKETTDFVVDQEIDNKLLLSMSPRGYIKRIH